jgi:hypothetical protein
MIASPMKKRSTTSWRSPLFSSIRNVQK